MFDLRNFQRALEAFNLYLKENTDHIFNVKQCLTLKQLLAIRANAEVYLSSTTKEEELEYMKMLLDM